MKLKNLALATSLALLFVCGAQARPRALALGPLAVQENNDKHPLLARDLKARLDKHEDTIILDARGTVSGQMIQGAVHVPLSKLEDWAKTADKQAFIVTYCTCPHDEAADSAVETLRKLGFARVFSLSGGLNAAQAAGIAVAQPSEQ